MTFVIGIQNSGPVHITLPKIYRSQLMLNLVNLPRQYTVESRISKLLSSKKPLISKQELMQAWITLYHKSHAE